MKATWKVLREAIGTYTNKSKFPAYFNINNNPISDRSIIADTFNNYFANIGRITGENVPKSRNKYTDF